MDSVDEITRLKNLKPEELDAYADEIRREIIQTVSKNGGHLASNLGVVELTMALHRVFTVPRDKIIWDVGHQCYPHKIITGRREAFSTLRKFGGISGFPKEEESPCDAFDTGHSTTSVSAALGLARARDLRGEDYHVAAVIGDGALTGGMAWEALNDAGHHRDRLLVILNDNTMSIRRNVGAMSSYLARMRTRPHYGRFKRRVLKLIRPGGFLYRFAFQIRRLLKAILVPGVFFEEIGWTYLGPIDGHNIGEMEKVFRMASEMREPVLIHLITRKGKGYAPAEEHPERFHSPAPFDTETGEIFAKGSVTTDRTAGDTILSLAEKDPSVCAITAAMADGCGLTRFAEKYPARFFDVGIAEEHAVTMAAGLAAGGMTPVVCMYATFLQRAYDQVIHDVCLTGKKVVFSVSHTGITGPDGETHQGILALSELLPIPNLAIWVPSSHSGLRMMLEQATRAAGPTMVLYGRELPREADEDPEPGKEYIRLNGDGTADAAVVSLGCMAKKSLEAVRLSGEEWDVFAVRCVKPLPVELIQTLLRKKQVVTCEDNLISGGFGEMLLTELTRRGWHGEFTPLGWKKGYVPQGDRETLFKQAGLDAEGILRVLKGKE